MSLYEIALFVHFLGLIAGFVGLAILQRGGAGLRQAATLDEVHLWLRLLKQTRGMFPAGFLLLLASGLYMAGNRWTFETPWVVVGLAGILLLWLGGAGVVGRRLEAIAEASSQPAEAAASLEAGRRPVGPELTRLIAQPAPWVVSAALNGLALGIVWIMVTKPGWLVSILVVPGLAIAGGILGAVFVRRGR